MNLQSPKVSVEKSAEYVFNALFGLKNFEKLLPETIAKFEVIDADKTEVQLDFDGEFNPIMAMMIKGPIGKFIETLAQNMGKL